MGDAGTPSTEQLLAMRAQFLAIDSKRTGLLERSKFEELEMWYEPSSSSFANKDVFYNAWKNKDGCISWKHLLLAWCADQNRDYGLEKATKVVLADDKDAIGADDVKEIFPEELGLTSERRSALRALKSGKKRNSLTLKQLIRALKNSPCYALPRIPIV